MSNRWDTVHPSTAWADFRVAFQRLFGMPWSQVEKPFREYTEAFYRSHYPRLKLSSAHALFFGSCQPLPPMRTKVLDAHKRYVNGALVLLDLFETIHFEHMEARIRQLAPEVQSEYETLQKLLGGAKVPRLYEAVFGAAEQKNQKVLQEAVAAQEERSVKPQGKKKAR